MGNNSILVVEDEHGVQEVIQHMLESDGYRVSLADHGREGLDLLRSMVELYPPSLVLLDIQMPELDGYGFLREKNSDPRIAHIPVVVVSATADVRLLSGVAAFVRKPFEMSMLLGVVARHRRSL